MIIGIVIGGLFSAIGLACYSIGLIQVLGGLKALVDYFNANGMSSLIFKNAPGLFWLLIGTVAAVIGLSIIALSIAKKKKLAQ